MSLFSDVKNFASNAAQKVADTARRTVEKTVDTATEKVAEVKQQAAQTLSRAEEEVSGLRSSFDKAKATVQKTVQQVAANGGLTAAIDVGALKKANPGTLAGIDEEGIARELHGQVMKDPKGVTDAIGGLDSSDRDDVSEELTKSLADDQLKELAGTPEGRSLLQKMRYELDEGPTWPGEQKQLDRIDAALKAVPAAKPAEVTRPAEPAIDPKKLAVTGAEYDPTKPKVTDDTALPEKGEEILANFSQLNGSGSSGQLGLAAGGERCGSTALVAGALAKGGRQGAVDLALQLAKNAKANKDPDRAKIYSQIAKNLSDPKTATYGELGRLSKTIFNQFSSDGQDAMSNTDLTAANKAAGIDAPGFVSAKHSGGQVAETYNNVDLLAPGQSWPAKIAVNGSQDGNHWIQMGKDKDGKVFIYDPMPKPGEPQIIYRDKDEASRVKFAAYQGAMFPGSNTTKGWADPG